MQEYTADHKMTSSQNIHNIDVSKMSEKEICSLLRVNYLPTKDQQVSWADTANGGKCLVIARSPNGVLPGVVTRTLPPSDSCIMSLNSSIHKRKFP